MLRNFKIFAVVTLLILTLTACSNSTTSTTDTTTSTDSTTTSLSPIGDWKYEGTIDNNYYDINLDLESNNTFELSVEAENNTEDLDSELQGTYVYTDDVITLTVATVQDTSGYFTGEVVQNEQIDLNYKIENNNLELSNANSVINFLPGDLTLVKD